MTEPIEATVPVGRYQILDPNFVSIPPPGQCALCGAHSRPVISFQFQVRNYGSVVWCLECTRSMLNDLGGAIGVIPIETFRQVRDERNELKAKVIKYEEIWSGLHHDLDSLLHNRLNSLTGVFGPSNILGDPPTEDLSTVEVRDGENSDGGSSESDVSVGTDGEVDSGDSSGNNDEPAEHVGSNPSQEFFYFGDLETSGQDRGASVE
jgi:hypothetical protein